MVGILAGGIGVAHKVEPVATPSFPVSRRCEQSIDLPRDRVGTLVVIELSHLGFRRRQSGEVVGQSAEQGATIGWTGR